MNKSKRNMGIELLRIVAMFLIVASHILTQGGLINNAEYGSSQYYTVWTLMIFCYPAVNCFALISGYVGVEQSKKSYSKIIILWLNVVFYTVLITLCFLFFTNGKVGVMEWLKALTPASTGQYWFFSAYFILFFMMPFLNKLIDSLDGKQAIILLLSLIVCFSIIPTLRQSDAFVLNSGYSPLWLIVLYLLGGVVKRLNLLEKIKMKWWVIILLSSLMLCIIAKFALEYIAYRLTGEVKGGGIFVSYISPLIVLIALSMLAIFARITIRNKFSVWLIRLISGSAFSVYIIHEHPLLKHQFLIDTFISYLQFSPAVLVLSVVGVAMLIFVVCTLIDWIRAAFFKMIKVNRFADAICMFVGKGVAKFYPGADYRQGENERRN